jgi:ABC-type sugar transport system ATPase subunit
MAKISLSNVSFQRGGPPRGAFSRFLALIAAEPAGGKTFSIENLSLEVPHGKTLVVLGPSGCGKSTLLRIISGLEEPDSGSVKYDGWDAKGIEPGQRRIGMVFQNHALYPNLNTKTNITSYFFFRKKTPQMNRLAEEKFRRTSELLDVDMRYLIDRMPSSLSGGEKQRVALGRCITRDPALFLMDEPFSNLDAKLRTKYRVHLKRLLKEFNITTVYVTHDQQEAVLLGDIISIMRMDTEGDRKRGWLEQTGKVQELYNNPVSMHVADFLNLHGDIQSISFFDAAVLAPAFRGITIGVRPEDVTVETSGGESGVDAGVTDVVADPIQQNSIVTLDLQGHEIVAKLQTEEGLQPSQNVSLRFRKYHVFDTASGDRRHAPKELRARLG